MVDVIHTAVWVSDLDETRAFYVDALGLSHTRDFESEGVTNFYVAGDGGAEIQFKHEPGRGAVDPSGIDHVAVSVDDTDAVLDRLRAATDTEVVMGPTTIDAVDVYVAFVTDPDGYLVELVEVLD
jgi:lactoylglutathione lyase